MNLLLEHIRSLPDLVARLTPQFTQEVAGVIDASFERPLNSLCFAGCGDSYFAALCSELAFVQNFVQCQVRNAMTFGRYAAPHLPGASSIGLVGISVSGGVSRTVEAVMRARAQGMHTVAITSSNQTPIGRAAEKVLVTTVPDLPNAQGTIVPGARSFYASMLMLVLMAAQLERIVQAKPASTLAEAVDALPAQMQQEIARADAWARDVARETLAYNHFVFCGSGPNFGAAQFAAAKMIEACGDAAFAQDVEEWAHLQYFAKQPACTLVLGVPAGADASRRAEVLTAMRHIGVPAYDLAGSVAANGVNEALSPFVTCIAPLMLAAHRAEALGEPYFRGFGGGRSVEGGGGISRIRTSEIIA